MPQHQESIWKTNPLSLTHVASRGAALIAEIAIVVGTRPELVKMAPVIRAFERKREVNLRLIHTGQHYDDNLSGSFFRSLNLPAPVTNLAFERIPTSRVHLTGNPIVDACQQHLETAKEESRILQTLALKPEDRYILLTVHRQENTADDQRLRNLIATLRLLSDYTIVFPVHPRTRLALMRNELWLELSSMQNVKVTEPLSYPDFLLLESGAFCV